MAMTGAQHRARSEFFTRVASSRGGRDIVRNLAIELIDLSAIAALSEKEMLRLPGIGPKNLAQIRTWLVMAMEDEKNDHRS